MHQELAVPRELLDAVVAGVGDVNVLVGVQRYAGLPVELAFAAASLAPLVEYLAPLIDYRYLVGAFVGDPEVLIAVHDHGGGPDELGVDRVGSANLGRAPGGEVYRAEVFVVLGETPDERYAAATQDEEVALAVNRQVNRRVGETSHAKRLVVAESYPEKRVWPAHCFHLCLLLLVVDSRFRGNDGWVVFIARYAAKMGSCS